MELVAARYGFSWWRIFLKIGTKADGTSKLTLVSTMDQIHTSAQSVDIN